MYYHKNCVLAMPKKKKSPLLMIETEALISEDSCPLPASSLKLKVGSLLLSRNKQTVHKPAVASPQYNVCFHKTT